MLRPSADLELLLLHVDQLQVFHLHLQRKAKMPAMDIYIHLALEFLAKIIRQRKKKKGRRIENEENYLFDDMIMFVDSKKQSFDKLL